MSGSLLAHASATRLRQPVISIGNLAMGGRGKTPVAAEVARLLLDAGERPAILSRGYGRRIVEDGATIVSDGTHILADVDRAGDEPLLLARTVEGAVVVVCDQRAIAGALAERVLGATVHVLDDGFQHRALARDVDIVVMTPDDFAGRPLPFGRLREPIGALSRADAVLLDPGAWGPGPGADAQGAWGPGPEANTRGAWGPAPEPNTPGAWGPGPGAYSAFTLSRALGEPIPLEPERGWPGTDAGVVAVAGIAAPSRFVRALESQDIRVAYAIEYRDHHAYGPGDLAHIAEAAGRWGVPAVLTTEKDAMRLLPHRPFPIPIGAVPLRSRVDDGAAFRAWLLARLAEARS